MEDHRMIITPKELNRQKKDLLIVDIRPTKQRNKIPLNGYDFKDSNNAKNEKSVYLGIRPEHVYIDKNNSDYFQINAKSELVEYIGHEQIVTFNYSEQQLLGKFPSTIDISMDKILKLHIDLNQISLFDKNTKERL